MQNIFKLNLGLCFNDPNNGRKQTTVFRIGSLKQTVRKNRFAEISPIHDSWKRDLLVCDLL